NISISSVSTKEEKFAGIKKNRIIIGDKQFVIIQSKDGSIKVEGDIALNEVLDTLKAHVNNPIAIALKYNKESLVKFGYNIKSKEDAQVGDVYLDEAQGIYFLLEKPLFSLGIPTGTFSEDLKIIKIPNSIETLNSGEEVINFDYYSLKEYAAKFGTVNVKLNKDNALISNYPYLSMGEPVIKDSVTDEEIDEQEDEAWFQSFANPRPTISTEMQEKALEWFRNHNLSKLISLNITDEINAKGPNFVADFFKNAITLYKGSMGTDVFHEAFHAFTQTLLSESERNAIYDVMRKQPGSFKVTVHGKEKDIKFSDASNLDIEEYLAEQFNAYSQNRLGKSKLNVKVREFFDRLLTMLKAIFGDMRISEARNLNRASKLASKTFEALYSNNVSVDKFVPSANEALYKSNEIATDFTMEEVHLVMDSIKSLFNDYLTYGINANNKKVSNLMLQLSSIDEELEPEKYEAVKQEFETTKELLRDKYTAYGVFAVQKHKPVLDSAITFVTNNLVKQKNRFERILKANPENKNIKFSHDVLVKALANLGDINSVDEIKGDKGYASLFGLFLNEYTGYNFNFIESEIKSEIKKEESQDVEDLDSKLSDDEGKEVEKLIFDTTNNDTSLQDLMDAHTKEILSTITKHTKNGKGVPDLNLLGFNRHVPLENMIAKVAKILTNTVSRTKMYDKLSHAAKTDNEIKELLFKLGDPSSPNTTFSEQKQWVSFWQSLNKADILLRQFVIEKTDTIENEKAQVELSIYSGRAITDSLYIGNEWQSNFNDLLQLSPYAKEDEKGERYIDVKAIFDEFQPDLKIHLLKNPALNLKPFLTRNEYINEENKKEYESTAASKYYSEPFQFLSYFGINVVDDPVVREIISKGSKELNFDSAYLGYVKELLENKIKQNGGKLYKFSDIFNGFNYKTKVGKDEIIENQPALYGIKNALQNLHTRYSNDNVSFMATTAYGEKQSEKALNSSLTLEMHALSTANSYDELLAMPGMEKFDININPFVAGNKAFVQLFNLDSPNSVLRGKKNPKVEFKLENLTGSKIKYTQTKIEEDGTTKTTEVEKGIASISSDEKTKFITDFYMTLEGVQEVTRMEAKSTTLAFYGTQLVNDEVRGNKTGDASRKLIFEKNEVHEIFSPGYKGTLLYEQFKYHLGAELVRIQRLKNLKEEILSSDEEFVFDFEYLDRGQDFMQFLNLLDKDTRGKLKNLLDDEPISVFDIDSLLSDDLKALIDSDMVKYFKSKALNIEINYNDIPFEKSTVEQYMTLNRDEKILEEDAAKKVMFQTFTLNNFINNMNFVHLFLGDIALYKISSEDFHKRNAGLISSGKISAVDQAFLDFVNSKKFEAFAYSSKFYQGTTPRVYNGQINTAVLEESKANSKYIESFREIIGEKAESYLGMDEADGQGWISFDMYRLLNFSYGEWSDGQEALYQKMIKGEKISTEDYLTTFPVRKFQYFGSVRAEDKFNQPLDGKGFHKYSLMPLIPALIQGTKLQKLHEKMMREGVDYTVMKSGSKLSSLSRVKRTLNEQGKYVLQRELDNFYDKDRNVVDNKPFVKNIISASHLKNVIYLAEGYKGKTTFATQMRKMVLHGLMENGVPVEYEGTEEQWKAESLDKKRTYKAYAWKERYFSSISKLRQVFKDELLEDISMKWDAEKQTYVGDTKAIVDYIKKELKKNDFLEHEIEGIADVNGNLIEDLSFDLNSQKIETILTALVDKKLRRFKVNGESMVQVSGAIFENFEKPTDEQLAEYGTNELKFYPIEKDADGKITVAAMEVKISLQGDFKNLIYLTHPSDKKIIAVKDNDGNIDWEASRVRLNQAIKDKNWVAENKSLLQFPGVRIPTQGPNALDVAIVAEFLPEWAGPIVILPSEIVAKTGADYDIDKMFFMLPSITRINGKVKLYQYKQLSVPYEQLKDENDNLKEDLKVIKKDIDAVKKEKDKLFSSKKLEIKDEVKALFEKQNKLIGKNKKKIEALNNTIATIATAKTGKNKKKQITEEAELKIQELEQEIKNIRKERSAKEKELFKEDADVMALIDKSNALYDKLNATSNKISENVEAMKNSSTKGIENEILQLLTEKILDASNIKDLITPNSVDDALPLSKRVRDAIQHKFNKFEKIHDDVTGSKVISPTTIFDYEYNLAKQQENSVGKDSLGIAAVVSTFYAIFTTFDSKLNAPTLEALERFENALKTQNKEEIEKFRSYALKLAHNYSAEKVGKYDVKRIALGKRTSSVNNKLIADTISQLINGYVDVAKDAWIFNIQGNKENTPTLLFMLMSGVELEDAVALSSNPLVMEYNKIKKEFQGVYSKIGYEEGNPVVEFNPKAASQAAYGKVIQNHPSLFGKPKFKGLNPASIDNQFDAKFDFESLWGRVGALTPNDDDVIYFSHYLQIEEMSNKLTEFQQANKHDTTKVANITDAENNIIKEENFFSKRSVVPESWKKEFEENPVGTLNNNKLIVDLFKQFFKIKNNPIVNQMAIKFSKEDHVKKAMPFTDTSRSAFKNDFIWFLYQNAVYNSNTSTVVLEDGTMLSFDVVEDLNSKYPIDIVEGDSDKLTVSFNSNLLRNELSMTTDPMIKSIYRKDGVTDVKEYAKFKFLFQENVANLKSISDQELFEKYYFLVSPKMTRTHLVKAITLYQLKPANSLFNSYVGADAIIKRMRMKHPHLNNLLLINDLKSNTDYKAYQSNIFLPKNTGKKLMETYVENLHELRNDDIAPEVAEFFAGFDHYLVMQGGLNAASKYFMGPLVSQNFILNTVYDQLDFDLMEQLFDEAYKTFRSYENKFAKVVYNKGVKSEVDPINVGLLSQFYDKISNLVLNNKWNSRGKGVNYTVDGNLDYGKGETQIKENAYVYGNVHMFNNISQANQSDFEFIFNPEMLFESDEDVTLEQVEEILKVYGDVKIAYPKKKVVAPEYLDQNEIDRMLLEHLGVDNRGNLPILVGKSKMGRIGAMSIANSVVKRSGEFVTDQYISSRSTKGIAFKAKQAPKYQSKHHAYIDELKNDLNKNEYVANDAVWIFGASLKEDAYANTSLKEYNESVKNFFNEKYVPEISKAIAAGVSTFNISAAPGGIATYAKQYLRNNGYKMVVEYGPDFQKYYSFNKSLEGKTSAYYDVTKPEVSMYDAFGKQITGVMNVIKEKMKGLSESDLIKNGLQIAEQALTSYFQGNAVERMNLSKLLVDTNGNALKIGVSPAAVYLEKHLMGSVLPFIMSSRAKRLQKEEVFNPQGLKTNSSGFVQGPVMKNFRKIEEIKGAEIYDGEVFDRNEADRLFAKMDKEFEAELSKQVLLAGKQWRLKNLYYGPIDYAYGSGESYKKHAKAEMPEWIEKTVRLIEKRMGVKPGYFDTALINKYSELSTGLGYHTDLEVNLTGRDGKVNPTVLTLSLGAQRKFGFKGIKQYAGNDLTVDAKHGHVLVMGYDSQLNYKHGVEKEGEQGVRYSITLRHTPDVNKLQQTQNLSFSFDKKNIFNVTPIQAADKKATIKASIATQFIGFGEGITGSSTENYRQQAGALANTGNYSDNDVIFVSIGGRRGTEEQQKTQQDRTIKEAIKAVEAGATILTDNKAYIDASSYNTGEKRLYANMEAKGYNYSEITVDGQLIGTWSKFSQPAQVASKSTGFTSSLFRGQEKKPTLDDKGNLVLQVTEDSLFKSKGISFADNRGLAEDYGNRYSKNPFIIEINKDYAEKIFPLNKEGGTQSYGNRVIGDEGEERFISNENIIIPAGQFIIHKTEINHGFSKLTGLQLVDAYNKVLTESDVAEYNRYNEGGSYATEDIDFEKQLLQELKARGIEENELIFLEKVGLSDEDSIIRNALNIDYTDVITNEQRNSFYEKQKRILNKLNQPTISNQPTQVATQLSLFDDISENLALWDMYKSNLKAKGMATSMTQEQFLSLSLEEQKNLANCTK
ncbi:MAG: Cellulophaga phage phi14:2, partial [Bacteroidota bacterium]